MEIQQASTASLIPYERNNRQHSQQQVDRIANSIAEFGFNQPIVVDENNIVLVGHGRLEAAKKLGLSDVPIMRKTGLTETQKKAYRILDNKLQNDSTWDAESLNLELAALEDADFDLAAWGLDDLAKLFQEEKTAEEDDFEPREVKETIIKVGDVLELGEHRVMCGDSTKAEDVQRLMGGEKAEICFTSPPYALGKSVALSGNRTMSGTGSAYDQHNDAAESWGPLMAGWWTACMEAVSHAWLVNVQPLAGNKRELMRWIHQRVDRLIDIVTWDKGHAAPQMAPGVMASRYEWIIALGHVEASRSIPLSTWRGTVSSVYQASPQRRNEHAELHAATMPLHLPIWIMGTLCDHAQSVLDPFCGTGTTLIAADQLGRKCYGMEISPQYCQVIVDRYKAHREKSGKPFECRLNGEDVSQYISKPDHVADAGTAVA